MPGPSITLERRRLNEEIESTFIEAARAASNVEMKIFSGKGSITGDLQEFYNRFSYLFRLTSNLKDMIPADTDVKLKKISTDIQMWMDLEIGNTTDEQLRGVAKDGLKLFDDYYKMLMHQGVIALPTRKG